MKQHILDVVQETASSKTALVVGAATASAPAWINFLNSEYTQAIVILIGMTLSVTIICVNIQTFKARITVNKVKEYQEQLRTALLEQQAKEKGLL